MNASIQIKNSKKRERKIQIQIHWIKPNPFFQVGTSGRCIPHKKTITIPDRYFPKLTIWYNRNEIPLRKFPTLFVKMLRIWIFILIACLLVTFYACKKTGVAYSRSNFMKIGHFYTNKENENGCSMKCKLHFTISSPGFLYLVWLIHRISTI